MAVESENRKPVILCMFSGGLDSLGALYRLLTAEDYQSFDIYAHHIILRNHQNRGIAELEACQAIVRFLRENKFRKFYYTQNEMDFDFMKNRIPSDADIYWFLAAQIFCSAPAVTHIATGKTRTDVEEGKTRGSFFAQNKAQLIFQCVIAHENRKMPGFISPVSEFTKKEVLTILPKPLADLAWSCRTPVYVEDIPRRCGNCTPCRDLGIAPPQ